MATATRSIPDATSSDLDGRREILLRPTRYPGTLIFWTLWSAFTVFFDALIVWIVTHDPRIYSQDPPLPGSAILLFILGAVAWHVFWLFAVFGCLWIVFGKERITLDDKSMVWQREIFKPVRTERFERDRIANVRVDRIRHNPWRQEPPLPGGPSGYPWKEAFGIGRGVVAFEYDGRTHRLGITIEDDEAARVAEEIAGWAGGR
jgi:hypothetical protein